MDLPESSRCGLTHFYPCTVPSRSSFEQRTVYRTRHGPVNRVSPRNRHSSTSKRRRTRNSPVVFARRVARHWNSRPLFTRSSVLILLRAETARPGEIKGGEIPTGYSRNDRDKLAPRRATFSTGVRVGGLSNIASILV